VLFCDGHIESMEKGDLDPRKFQNTGQWNYQGK